MSLGRPKVSTKPNVDKVQLCSVNVQARAGPSVFTNLQFTSVLTLWSIIWNEKEKEYLNFLFRKRPPVLQRQNTQVHKPQIRSTSEIETSNFMMILISSILNYDNKPFCYPKRKLWKLYNNKMINKNSSNFSTFYIFNALYYVKQYIIIIRFPFRIGYTII